MGATGNVCVDGERERGRRGGKREGVREEGWVCLFVGTGLQTSSGLPKQLPYQMLMHVYSKSDCGRTTNTTSSVLSLGSERDSWGATYIHASSPRGFKSRPKIIQVDGVFLLLPIPCG